MTDAVFSVNDQDGRTIVRFSELLYSPDRILDRVRGRVVVQKDGFGADLLLDLERSDLVTWSSGLRTMYDDGANYAALQPEGGRFKLLYELRPTGHIQVEVQASDVLFTTKLNVRFITDRTHLPVLIDSLETFLEACPPSRRG